MNKIKVEIRTRTESQREDQENLNNRKWLMKKAMIEWREVEELMIGICNREYMDGLETKLRVVDQSVKLTLETSIKILLRENQTEAHIHK